jgi:hypothetical protein
VTDTISNIQSTHERLQLCSSCGTEPAGKGEVLCPGCLAAITARTPDDIYREALERLTESEER